MKAKTIEDLKDGMWCSMPLRAMNIYWRPPSGSGQLNPPG